MAPPGSACTATPIRLTSSGRSPVPSGRRASSSPPSLQVMRWSKVENADADPPEVYDMAAGDGEFRSPQSGTPPERRSPRRFARTIPSGAKRQRALFRDTVLSNQSDAWTLEDWCAPACLDERLSQITDRILFLEGSQSLDKEQRMIADVVRAEMQVDLESVVHRAMLQMHAHIKEDVFKTLKKAEQHSSVEFAELQRTIAGSHVRLEELEKCFHEYTESKKWDDDIGPVFNERAAISKDSCFGFAENSRFDAIEKRLDNYRKRFEAVDAQDLSIHEKLAKCDVDIQANVDALHDAEIKFMNACEKERLNAQNIWIRQAESLKQQSDLERTVASELILHDLRLGGCTDAVQCLKTQMSNNESELLLLRSAVEYQSEKTDILNAHVQDFEAELQAKLEEKVDIESSAERDESRDKQLRDISRQTSEILEVSENSLQTREEDMSKVANAIQERDQRIDTLDAELRRTQADLAEEICRSRDQLYEDLCGEAQPRLMELTQRVENVQAVITGHKQVLSQHTEWIQKLSKSALTGFMCKDSI